METYHNDEGLKVLKEKVHKDLYEILLRIELLILKQYGKCQFITEICGIDPDTNEEVLGLGVFGPIITSLELRRDVETGKIRMTDLGGEEIE